MKTIQVVAAVIRKGDAVFATARGYGAYKGQWEFPGGKIETGETAEQALIREIQEELDTQIAVGQRIGCVEYDYPTFHLSMECFWCTIVSGALILKEAQDCRWLRAETLRSVDWLPADQQILDTIAKGLQEP